MEVESTPDNNGGGNIKTRVGFSEPDVAANHLDSDRPALTIDVSVKPSASTTTSSSGRNSTGENTPTNYDGTKIPFKPALKSASSMDADDDNSDDGDGNKTPNSAFNNPKKKKKSKKKGRTLKWDEAKIEEHDKLRGTRMKIEEPNTPFAASYYDSGSETDCSMNSRGNRSVSSVQGGGGGGGDNNKGISWDALTNRLEAHAAVASMYPPSSPSSHGGSSHHGNDPGGSSYCTTDEEDHQKKKTEKRERQGREMRKLEFQEHRKRHYNEMEVVRRFRRENPSGEPSANGNHSSANSSVSHDRDDDDDDDDDDNYGDDET